MPSEIVIKETLDLSNPLEALWPLLSDTDRTNRLIGLPASKQVERAPDLSRIIHSHYHGVPVTWHEYPFEWVFERWFSIERVFESPIPVTHLTTYTALERRVAGGTRVTVQVNMQPRNVVGRMGARAVVGRTMVERLLSRYREIDAAIATGLVTPLPQRNTLIDRARLSAGTVRLRQAGLPADLIEALAQHLATAEDPDVLRMRPFALADRWGVPRLDTLRLFLFATRAGMLDMEWDVMCPNCRGPSLRAIGLGDLTTEAHCSSCFIRYNVDFDQSVELRFSVNPQLRKAEDVAFCVGGPANTRHIVAQIWLAAGQRKDLAVRFEPGIYRIRTPQLSHSAHLDVRSGGPATSGAITLTADAISVPEGDLAPGEVALTLENASETGILLLLEQTAWSAQAASAALVTALDEFRQLFSSEVLAPGLGLAIRNLTFLFSDLKDSTAIYDSIGDAPAFARVRDHFEVMRSIIARWRGALVKTIGDAVMAVFTSADDAVEAAFEIQREFTIGEIALGRPALRIKLGVHRGACIAVNANELLDYFGSTVNIAARVQNESIGGDVVLTADVADDPRVRQIIERIGPEAETFERQLKGVSGSFTLYRLWPPEHQALLAA